MGYMQYIGVTDNGGGFSTFNTIKRNLELVGTSLAASDGTTFRQPASREGKPMPAARAYHGCAALNGKLYVVGGSGTSTVFVYDPATDAWSSGPSLIATGNPRVVAAQGLLVAFPVLGGVTTFDPATGSWTQRRGSAIPWPTDEPSFASFHDQTDDWAGVVVSNLSGGLQVYAFDPAGNRWVTGVALTGQTDRRWFSAVSLGTNVYVTGGYMQYLMGDNVRKDTVLQDLTTGHWFSLTNSFTDARYSHATAAVGGKLFVLGGEDVAHYLRSVENYDPATGKWTKLFPLLRPRRHACAAVLNGKIYVTGGDVGGSTYMDSVEVYQP